MKNAKLLSFGFSCVLLSACGPEIPYVTPENSSSSNGPGPILEVDPPEVVDPEPGDSTTSPEDTSKPQSSAGSDEFKPDNEINEAQTRMIAAQNDLVSALSLSGGDIDQAIFSLVEQNKPDAIKLAKQRGANVNKENSEHIRPLQYAVEQNKLQAMQALIEEEAEINYMAPGGTSPLIKASQKGYVHLIKPLVDAGGDINFHSYGSYVFFGPLHTAVYSKQLDVAKALISLGADVNLAVRGTRPAHLAAQKRNPLMLKLLLESGANPRFKTMSGKDVFQLVDDQKGSPEYAELLLVLKPYR